MQWTDSTSRAATEARTIRVTDAFTTGGAQVAGGRHALQFEYATDVDYIRGRNSVRTGILLNGIHYRSDDASNYLGTFTFASQAAFDAGQPSTFTQRLGDPLIEYWYLQAGLYVQDDLRFSKAATFSVGVRYETANAPGRLQQHRSARGTHLGAVQERPHDDPRELGPVPPVAQLGDLRTDAARGRGTAAGPDDHQPDLPDRGDARYGGDGQPLSAGTGPRHGARDSSRAPASTRR